MTKTYAAKLLDGTYGFVEAVSWQDAKRYYGVLAVSIRQRKVSEDLYFAQMFDPDLRRRIYEGDVGEIDIPQHAPKTAKTGP